MDAQDPQHRASPSLGETLDALDTREEKLAFLERVINDHTRADIFGTQTLMGVGCLDIIEQERLYLGPSFAEYLRTRWGLLRSGRYIGARQG